MNFIHKSQIKEGTVVVADGGFTCVKRGEKLVIHFDELNLPYFYCSSGRHYLSGQQNKDEYIGLYLEKM